MTPSWLKWGTSRSCIAILVPGQSVATRLPNRALVPPHTQADSNLPLSFRVARILRAATKRFPLLTTTIHHRSMLGLAFAVLNVSFYLHVLL